MLKLISVLRHYRLPGRGRELDVCDVIFEGGPGNCDGSRHSAVPGKVTNKVTSNDLRRWLNRQPGTPALPSTLLLSHSQWSR